MVEVVSWATCSPPEAAFWGPPPFFVVVVDGMGVVGGVGLYAEWHDCNQ